VTSPQYDPYQQYPASQQPGQYPYPPQPQQAPQPVGYQQPAAFRPTTRVLLAIVGGLLALCAIGGTAAAFIIEKGLPDVLPSDLTHRQPADPCALLGAAAFGTDFGGQLAKATKGDKNTCDYTFAHDSRSPEATGSTLRLYVEVSASAETSFEAAQGVGLSRLPVQCGQTAFAGHKIDSSAMNVDATLWCLNEDTYLMLTLHAYNHDRFSGLVLDEALATLGRTTIANVPKA